MVRFYGFELDFGIILRRWMGSIPVQVRIVVVVHDRVPVPGWRARLAEQLHVQVDILLGAAHLAGYDGQG